MDTMTHDYIQNSKRAMEDVSLKVLGAEKVGASVDNLKIFKQRKQCIRAVYSNVNSPWGHMGGS